MSQFSQGHSPFNTNPNRHPAQTSPVLNKPLLQQTHPFELEQRDLSQSLDESLSQMAIAAQQQNNKTFVNSINSSFYNWDHDDSFLLSELDAFRPNNHANHKPQQTTHNYNHTTIKTQSPAIDPYYLQQLMNQQQRQNPLNPKQPQQQQQFTQQQQNPSAPQLFAMSSLTEQQLQAADKMGETVISEYVSEYNHGGSPQKLAIQPCLNLLRKKSSQQQQKHDNQAGAEPNTTDKEILNLTNNSQKNHKREQSNQITMQRTASPASQMGTSTEKQFLSIAKNQELQKPIYLNAIVVGAQGLGKSTFIDAFLNRKFTKEGQDAIRATTTEIKEHKGTRAQGNVNLHLNMIDTPGYSAQHDLTEWKAKISSYIKSKFDEYEAFEDQELENPNILQSNESLNQDHRINVCLYFMSGPRISETDYEVMKDLQEIVNVIPILAKGDCFTPEEVKAIKSQMLKDAHDKNIQWFDCEAPLKHVPHQLEKLRNGTFGQAPPFLMISSVQRIQTGSQQYEYARKYPWGVCKIENPEHSDFMLLYQLLISYFLTDLKKLTEYYYKHHLKEKKRNLKLILENQKALKKKQADIIKGGVIAAVGMVLVGLFRSKTS